jgi:hypothetical protein
MPALFCAIGARVMAAECGNGQHAKLGAQHVVTLCTVYVCNVFCTLCFRYVQSQKIINDKNILVTLRCLTLLGNSAFRATDFIHYQPGCTSSCGVANSSHVEQMRRTLDDNVKHQIEK